MQLALSLRRSARQGQRDPVQEEGAHGKKEGIPVRDEIKKIDVVQINQIRAPPEQPLSYSDRVQVKVV